MKNERLSCTHSGVKNSSLWTHICTSTNYRHAVSGMQDLDMIMREGPMPTMPIELQAAMVNYCYGLPTDLAKDLFLEDYSLFCCYGVHPNLADTVTQKNERSVMSKVNFDS